mmetsp:Transcript_40422/g.89794  ORF Transcript_40422/g.89794 Transcript_40422/m.89794 type:complete len:232 (-) Transcript_40422:1792-2487(-)
MMAWHPGRRVWTCLLQCRDPAPWTSLRVWGTCLQSTPCSSRRQSTSAATTPPPMTPWPWPPGPPSCPTTTSSCPAAQSPTSALRSRRCPTSTRSSTDCCPVCPGAGAPTGPTSCSMHGLHGSPRSTRPPLIRGSRVPGGRWWTWQAAGSKQLPSSSCRTPWTPASTAVPGHVTVTSTALHGPGWPWDLAGPRRCATAPTPCRAQPGCAPAARTCRVTCPWSAWCRRPPSRA